MCGNSPSTQYYNLGNGFATRQCCGYSQNGAKVAERSKGTNGYDCVMIPGASKQADKGALISGAVNGFCGGELASIAAGSVIAATICCKFQNL